MGRLRKTVSLLVCLGALAGSVRANDTAGNQAGSSSVLTGSFQIRNVKFGDLLRPENANAAEGTRIVLYPAEPWKCMTWKLHPAGDSVFHVQNHFTSKTFVVSSTNVIETTLVHDAAQRPAWRFTKLPDGTYEITEAKSDAALTAVSGDDQTVRIIVVPWHNTDNQKWRLEKIDPATLTM